MKRFFQIILIVGVVFLTTNYLLPTTAAFIGPGSLTPGTGGGSISLDPNQNLGFGTYSLNASLGANYNTPPGGTFSKVFMIAATSSPPGFALRNLATTCTDSTCNTYGLAPATWVMQTTPWGAFSVYNADATFTGARDRFLIFPNGNVALGGPTGPATSTLNVFGNVYSSGAFIGSLSGGLSAANVSGPSAFGSNYGTYNYAMPGALAVGTSTTVGLPANGLYVVGNVGVGTASPSWPMTIYGGGSFLLTAQNSGTNSAVIGAKNSTNSTYIGVEGSGAGTTILGTLAYASFVANQGAYALQLGTNNNIRMTIDSSGNVGIGTTSPGAKLQVSGAAQVGAPTLGNLNGVGFYLTNTDPQYGLTAGVSPSGDAWIQVMRSSGATAYNLNLQPSGGNILFPGSGVWQSNGNVGVSTSTPSYTLDVVGTARFTQPVVVGTPVAANQAATKNYVDSAFTSAQTSSSTSAYVLKSGDVMSGNLNMNGNNILGVGKLTVTTLDPLYEIGGSKYATYGPDVIGLKVEYFGKSKLQRTANNEWKTTINVGNAEKGSDLWVFWQTSDTGKNLSDLNVSLTPQFNGRTWYELNPKQKQVIIYADILKSDPGTEPMVSYHLVAPRFDANEWGTKTDTSERGTVLPIK